jgi:hypothetical protein
MKIIKIVPNGDYEGLDFSRKYEGLAVSELITRVEAGEKFTIGEDKDRVQELDFRITEIPENNLSVELIKYTHNDIQDYEDTKHSPFWFDSEII